MIKSDTEYLRAAIEKAKESVAKGGFPAGAIVVKNNEVIGSGISIGNVLHDPTSHGEMSSIRDACKNTQSSDLSEAVLYASMQPCVMCFSAAMWASISKIVYACSQEKVSKEYYGGEYNISLVNEKLIHPLELIHVPELEEDSLRLVEEWQNSIK